MRRRQVPSFAVPAYVPPPVMNTTPLIDVMLVLLIMFIVTIPIASHKVPLDLPQGPPPAVAKKPAVHRLELDAAGALGWDGRAIAQAELPALLAAMQADPNAELHLRADGETPYERFDQVLATVKRAGVTKLGMIGNGQFVEDLR